MSTKLVLALGLSFGVGVTIVGFRVADKMDVKVLIGPHYHQSTNTPPTPTPPVVTNGGQAHVGREPHVSNYGIHFLPNSPPGCNIACNGVVRESKIPPPPSEAECNAWQHANIRRVCDLR